jgi:hypothetical protein
MPAQTDAERLRDTFLERAIESYGLTGVKWTPRHQASEIANFLPSFYGLARAARNNENPSKFWDEQTLKLEVQNLGFSSVAALLGALNQLRESLKSELSEEDWRIFFNGTLDITS